MKRIRKLSLWLMGAIFALALFNVKAEAALTQAVDIRVSINATKSILVGTTFYNYGALSVNVSSVSSAILVTNNSGALLESYTLQTAATANSTQGGTAWTLSSSTGALDTYALAAQFSNAQPTNLDASWATDDLTASPVNCTATAFGNSTLGESGQSVSPVSGSNTRNLFFRIRTPVSVSDTTQRLATVTLAIQ